jgi:hypothetical protein
MKDYEEWLEQFYPDDPQQDGSAPVIDEEKNQDEEGVDPSDVADQISDPASDPGGQTPTQEGGAAQSKGAEALKEGTKKGVEAAKKGAEAAKKGADAAKKVGKLSKMLGPLAPVLGYIAIIVAVLIAAIGLLMFLLTMPGAILDKLKSIAQSFGNSLINAIYGEVNNVKASEIANVGTKMEDMGYDLYAYGFLSDKLTGETYDSWGKYYKAKYKPGKDAHDLKYDDWLDEDFNPDVDSLYVSNDGILRDKNGVVLMHSIYARWYLLSDNYVYIIRNNESNFLRTLFGLNGDDGLINLYKEKNKTIGTIDGPLTGFDHFMGFLRALFAGSRVLFEMDRDGKQLIVTTEADGVWGVKRKFYYSLDGWTGRYGMPLEFLLSLHLSSMQPDLAYDLVKQVKTEIKLVGHETDTKVFGGVQTDSDGILTSKQLDDKVKELEQQRDAEIAAVNSNSELTEEEKESQIAAIRATYDPDIAKYKRWYELAKVLDTTFTTLIPYIYQVENHWFRDVYFTDNERSDFIVIDDEYEKRTAERWTKYETATIEDSGIDTSDLENTIQYGASSDGYAAERSEYTRGGLGDVQYVLYYYRDGNIDDEVKYMYEGRLGTQEDADIDTSLKQVEKDSLHKKAIVESFEYMQADAAPDDYEGKLSGFSDRWVAYKEKTNDDLGWKKYVREDGDKFDNPLNASDDEMERVYYKLIIASNVIQIEDGQRGPTNALTKKMFSINKYYTYNGTAERARQIDLDRYDWKIDENGDDVENPSGTVYNEYKKYMEGDYEGSKINKDDDPRDKDLIETFSVSRDSMSAFNILTNMNTIDSDAIYHDFKELIVELDFFDKEELTYIPNQSFEWPIPEIGSRNWPVRAYSKYENDYGTALHSKYCLNFLKEKDGILASVEGPEEEEVYEEGNEEEPVGALKTILATENIGQIQGKKTEFLSPFDDLELRGNDSVAGSVGASVGDKSPSEVSVDEFLEATKTMALEMGTEGFNYCVGSSCKCSDELKKLNYADALAHGGQCSGPNHCHHHIHPEDGCWWKSDYKVAIETHTKRNTCCATFVSWALVNVGVMKGTVNAAGRLADWIKNNLECEVIEQGGVVKPGDIMVCGRGHIYVLGPEKGSGFLQYDGGHSYIGSINPDNGTAKSFIEPAQSAWGGSETEAIRLFGVTTTKSDSYKGYKGGELVVSPVTGMVIQAGASKKITNIETGLTEYVGYVKIRVLDRTDFTAAFGADGSDEEDLEGYKYFLEEYEDNKVAGDIMYIEGFSMELLREYERDVATGHVKYILNNESPGNELFNSNMVNSEGEVINEYTKTTYDDVLNKRTRKKLEEKEAAREKAAPYYIDSNGNFFIKEGTALGTTYLDFAPNHDYRIEYQEYLNEMREELGLDTLPIVQPEATTSDDPRIGRMMSSRPGLVYRDVGSNISDWLYDETGNPSNFDKLKENGDGNYIRIILRASRDGTDNNTEKDSLIEDVEDYIEIDPAPINQIDWELFFWTPHESGPADPNGPICYEDHVGSTCMTIGMIQWMSAYDDGGNKNIQYMLKHLGDYDSGIGSAVNQYTSWTNSQIKEDIQGDREIEKSLQVENSKNHDLLIWAELEVAKAQYLEPLLKDHSWLSTRPKCVQGAIMHIGVHDGHYPSDMDDWQNLSDEDVLNKVGEHWNDGSWQYKEPGIAKAILAGKLTDEDVEYWVRNKDVDFLISKGVDYYGEGS